ncbi:MAG TPA: SDR family NAD(P)-dependent oxidoreductase [Polyangia bacterium]
MTAATADLVGRNILITGANTGIGRTAALALAKRGARLLLAGRSAERTAPVVDEIARLGGPAASFVALDLADLSSVQACVSTVVARGEPLHVLINNAGQGGANGLTRDGFEMTIGTNHLGPFVLTLGLLDLLRASAPSRVVMVASRAHKRISRLDFSGWTRARGAGFGIREYAASKLANVLFARALAKRLAGTGVTTYAVHPGVVASEIWRRVPGPLRALMKLTMISNEEGALTTVHCATAPEAAAESGLYYSDCRPTAPSRLAQDDDLAERMWAESLKLVGADRLK